MRNTVVCIIIFLCLEGVLSQSSLPETSVKNLSSPAVTFHASVTPSKSDVSSSLNTSAASSSVNSSSDSSSTVSFTSPVLPSVKPSSTSIQPSFVPMPSSGSRSATPVLSSAMMSSTQVVPVPTSSTVASMTSSAAAFVTPSPTAVMVPESIDIKDNNVSCLAAKMEVDFTILYNSTAQHNKTVKLKTVIPLNGDAKTRNVTGTCDYATGKAFFVIKWNEHGIVTGPQHIFRMDFKLDRKTRKWTVPKVTAVFMTSDTSAFKHPEQPIIKATADSTKRFGSRKNGTNYICKNGIDVTLSNDVTAKFKDLVLQPFSHKDKLVNDGDDCPADDKDDNDNTVPIAVGAALGGLVLIVLIAYIVGRRRSSRGYEQV